MRLIMSNRKTILDNLKDDFKNNLTLINGYNNEPAEVVLAIRDPNEFTLLPSLGIWMLTDVVTDDLMDASLMRDMGCMVYGYADSDGYGGYDNLYTFIHDIETFLYSTDNRSADDTRLLDNTIVAGGSSDSIGMFVINFSITYEQTLG